MHFPNAKEGSVLGFVHSWHPGQSSIWHYKQKAEDAVIQVSQALASSLTMSRLLNVVEIHVI